MTGGSFECGSVNVLVVTMQDDTCRTRQSSKQVAYGIVTTTNQQAVCAGGI